MSIYVNPMGRIDNCCVSQNFLGDINKDDLQSVIHGEKNQKIMEQFRAGQMPAGCTVCANKGAQLKDEYIKWFSHRPELSYPPQGDFVLRYADLRWSNTCNFGCVYCNEELSSVWAQELQKFPKMLPEVRQDLVKFLLDNLHTLDYLYLAGGEPLMIKDNEVILQRLLEVNPKCDLRINTNLYNIDNNIWRLATQFEKLQLIVSFDDVGDKYDYIRYGGKWQRFADNLLQAQKVCKHITFNAVYMAINTLTIFDCLDFLQANKFNLETVTLLYYNLGNGGPLDARNLPPDQIAKAKEAIQARLLKTPNGYLKECLTNILYTLQLPYDNGHFPPLTDFLQQLDSRRKLDSKLLFPEIYQ